MERITTSLVTDMYTSGCVVEVVRRVTALCRVVIRVLLLLVI